MWENIVIALAIIIGLSFLGIGLYYFFKLEKSKQLEIVSEWLLLAVVQAEKELGTGTGQIKLRFVYDMFLSKFKFTSKFVTFNQFSLMVDIALAKMNDLLQSNSNLQNYINKNNNDKEGVV